MAKKSKEDQKIEAERVAKRKKNEKYFTARRPGKALEDYILILRYLAEDKEVRVKVKSNLTVTNRTLRDLIMTDGRTTKAVSINKVKNIIIQNDYLIVDSIMAIETMYEEQDS